MSSILTDTKKLLGIDAEVTNFDTDIIININSALMFLNQLGVGPEACFTITGSEEEWDDFDSTGNVEAVKLYVVLKTKLTFDPPSNSASIEAYERQIRELEFRLNIQSEGGS